MEVQLTEKQVAALEEFREITKSYELPEREDTYLLKWLVARDFDCAKADKMLKASLEWRIQNRVDEMSEDWQGSEVLKKYFVGGYPGVDKLGCPLCIIPYGRADIRGLLLSVRHKEYIQCAIWFNERGLKEMKKSSQRLGRPVTQLCTIFDLEHFSMRHITYRPAMNMTKQFVQMFEANYPEYQRKVFAINAPKVFTVAFAMLKPFLHEATLKKIQIFGCDDRQWKAALLEEIDPDQLPAHYGGTMTDPDGNPYCITKVCMGGEVPKSYYQENNPAKPKEKHESLTISHGKVKKLEYEIKNAGDVLHWEFICEDKDIAYTVYRKDENHNHEIVPRERVESSVVEEGQIICSHPGTYIVEFDNSFSYLRSKTIHYFVRIDSN